MAPSDMTSTLVFGADTWLHLVTKTVSIAQATIISGEDVTYSLSLNSPNCTTTNNTMLALSEVDLSCSLNPITGDLQNGVPAFFTLNNQSNELSVLNDGPDGQMAYLTVNPSQRKPEYDFSAQTFGIKSACHPITTTCNTNGTGGAGSWNCSNGAFAWSNTYYKGVPPKIITGFYDNEAMSNDISGGGDANPFYYAMSAATETNSLPNNNLAADPEFQIVTMPNGGRLAGAILLCSVGVYEVNYNVFQGKVTYMNSNIANASVANLFVTALSQGGFGEISTQNSFDLATYISNTAQELADHFAIAYSKIALSLAAGSVTRVPVSIVESESTLLLAKVPKAPLLLLIIVNLIFVVLGLVLAVLAGRTSPEAYEIQTRFSVAGIVAAKFERTRNVKVAGAAEKLFEECYEGKTAKRVGLERCRGGAFEFKVLDGKYPADVEPSDIVHLHQRGWKSSRTRSPYQESDVWM